jgi:acetyltransferase-like isoleucine patch superfamily enzyme
LLEIGDDVYIGDDCIVSCAERVTIGAGTLLGHGVQIFDNNSHPVDVLARAADWEAVRIGGSRGEIESSPVAIGERAWIGFGSVVLKGVSIGAGAIVGAGSVVTRDVAADTVVAGNPAQLL